MSSAKKGKKVVENIKTKTKVFLLKIILLNIENSPQKPH
jgi:hypothetical protein